MQRTKELKNKKLSRKQLNAAPNTLRLIKKNAKQIITAKFRKEEEMKKKRNDVNFMRI
jgi:uncharacterized protein YbcV (DUF1398 family)